MIFRGISRRSQKISHHELLWFFHFSHSARYQFICAFFMLQAFSFVMLTSAVPLLKAYSCASSLIANVG